MHRQLAIDFKNLDDLLSLIKNKSLDYLQQIETIRTSRTPRASAANKLPTYGYGTQETTDIFYENHFHNIVASSGPRYWGFVTGGTTPAAIAGDWLTSVFDQNTQGITGPGDISAIVEQETIQMILDLFGLPNDFTGGFVTGATMANFTGLAVARQWAGLQNNNDIARKGIKTNISVLSATPHSSSVKCLSLLGIGSNNVVNINSLAADREAIDIAELQKALKENAGYPVILISSGGTVNTVDFDDMSAIATLKKEYDFWWHIDAAFGGFAACSPAYSYLLSGWENADSITIDCHKWMNVPYDSAVYLVNKKYSLLQVQTFQNSNAPYLGNPEDNFSYLNFGPENSRRFRALPAWFSLMAYGRTGFKWIVENNIELAKELGKRLEAETIFKLAAPVRLNVVCFTTSDKQIRSEQLQQTSVRLNERGKLFVSATMYKGVSCLRAALVNWRTSKTDIDIAIKELQNID